ncbi:glycoside hydrolase family 2 TIM barrel-domain containing protein [Halalkalibaculum sp. DA3122]|uniref:glycoside hydrolase family 2 TIM barrel-domain containing protein n=1 Tax=Halalkalibaculum sp. DA3122 TaxID=3373607 RepID=UPI003754EF35
MLQKFFNSLECEFYWYQPECYSISTAERIKAVVLVIFFFFAVANTAIGQNGSNYKTALNGEWEFKTDLYNVGITEEWYRSSLDTEGWETMEVPGNWDLKNEYADYVGKAWYRKTFEAPEEWRDRAIRLYFESVYNDVQVWVNGEHIGEHHVGFLPFWFDIRDKVKFGEENTLAVRADNTFKRGAIWNWGGIRRPVWLEITDKTRLENQHITSVPDINKGTADIDVALSISNQSDQQDEVEYEVIIKRNGSRIWHSDESNLDNSLLIEPGDTTKQNVSLTLAARDVDLWHFNDPNLYECIVRIYRDGKPVHQLSDRFGIRKIEVVGESLHLNGESIRTVGFNLVPEDRTTGSTLPLWRIKKDVDMMKALGANMARLSHLPLPEEFLDYLDEKGIMTFEEVSLWGKDNMVDPEHPLPKYWLNKMIQVKYNHPSIIGWSVGNEIGFTDRNPKVMEYVEGAIDQVRKLDPTRLAIYVTHSADHQEVDPVEFSDMIMFNAYGNWSERVEKAHELHPGKPIFMSEYGDHLNDENLNEAHINGKKLLNEFRGKSYMVGASLWTFNDYRSFWKAGPTWTTPPSQNRTWGVVDVHRQKKRAYYTYRREHAPVERFVVKHNNQSSAEISLTPRGNLDIPAYTLKGYTLVWTVADKNGEILDGGLEQLPVINPGDDHLQKNIRWDESDVDQLHVDLLDPQQYSVRDTTTYFTPPDSPEVISVHSASNSARIVFEPVDNAGAYKAVYGIDGFTGQTSPTINDYIELNDLEELENYRVKLIAINNAGESKPTEIIDIQLDEDELPPIIRDTTPADESFFVGYSVDRIDYMYEVKYGTSPGNYTNTIGLRNVGVLQVPNLENGTTYYYKIRNRKQWGFASEWSHEVSVTPDGDLPPFSSDCARYY